MSKRVEDGKGARGLWQDQGARQAEALVFFRVDFADGDGGLATEADEFVRVEAFLEQRQHIMRTGKGLETMNGAFENHPPPFSSSDSRGPSGFGVAFWGQLTYTFCDAATSFADRQARDRADDRASR